jgi:hypothetical protein
MEDLFTDTMMDDSAAASGGESAMVKALMAGYGTDAAQYEGGRVFQPEDCESATVIAMRERAKDFKLMNSLKRRPVGSTVHQYNVQSDVGDVDLGFTLEGGVAPNEDLDVKRYTSEMKYILKRREITEQALITAKYEDAYDIEKRSGILSVLRTAEKACFHGDAAVVPEQFNGLLTQIKSVEENKRNIVDFRGKTIATIGEKIFTDMAEMIYDKGGEMNKSFYPPILGGDIQDLCRDRLRFGTEDKRMSAVFNEYPTLYGALAIAGDEAGPDKLFYPKKVVKPGGDVHKLPNPPASVVLTAAPNSKTQFKGTSHTGTFKYTIHAISAHGISVGKDASVAVADGDEVKIVITPDSIKPGTGFIVCRSAPGGSDVMEMVKIAKDGGPTTTYIDLNEDLPGTADMLFITEGVDQVVAEFFQLMPARVYRMFPTDRLVTPFIVTLWGTPALKIPHWSGIAKNIAYRGGLYG